MQMKKKHIIQGLIEVFIILTIISTFIYMANGESIFVTIKKSRKYRIKKECHSNIGKIYSGAEIYFMDLKEMPKEIEVEELVNKGYLEKKQSRCPGKGTYSIEINIEKKYVDTVWCSEHASPFDTWSAKEKELCFSNIDAIEKAIELYNKEQKEKIPPLAHYNNTSVFTELYQKGYLTEIPRCLGNGEYSNILSENNTVKCSKHGNQDEKE